MESAAAVLLSGISYWWFLEENKNKLIATIERLHSREVDVQSRKSAELRPRKKLKMETQTWLEQVKKTIEEARDLVNKVAGVGMMERASLGRSLCVKIEEAEKLYEMGNFADGLVFDETPRENTGSASADLPSVLGKGGFGETPLMRICGTTIYVTRIVGWTNKVRSLKLGKEINNNPRALSWP